MDGCNTYIALVDYINTPLSGMQFSPAQLFMSRNLHTKLPTSSAKLKPTVVKAKQQLGKMKEQQRKFYYRGSRELPTLKSGDMVRIMRAKTNCGVLLWSPNKMLILDLTSLTTKAEIFGVIADISSKQCSTR